MSDLVPTVPDFLIWHCVGCGAPAEGKKKPCDCVTNVGGRTGPNGRHEHTWWVDPEDPEITRLRARITELEGERDRLCAKIVVATNERDDARVEMGRQQGRANRNAEEHARQQARAELVEGELERIDCLLATRTAQLQDAEGERDTATRALAVLDKIAWLAAEEDSWFGDETDIAVQRAAAERHRAALSKTEGKG